MDTSISTSVSKYINEDTLLLLLHFLDSLQYTPLCYIFVLCIFNLLCLIVIYIIFFAMLWQPCFSKGTARVSSYNLMIVLFILINHKPRESVSFWYNPSHRGVVAWIFTQKGSIVYCSMVGGLESKAEKILQGEADLSTDDTFLTNCQLKIITPQWTLLI